MRYDAIAGRKFADVWTDLDHLPRAVADGNNRESGDGVVPRRDGNIDEIQAGGAQADEHLAAAGNGVWQRR